MEYITDLEEMVGINVAELIPYSNVAHMIDVIKKEYYKGRKTEIWDSYIYSVERRRHASSKHQEFNSDLDNDNNYFTKY